MLRQILVVLVALALARAEYFAMKSADKDFLLKQKKVYNLLFHVSQPELVVPQVYEDGKDYNIEANIDSYTNTAVVKEFLGMYSRGMLPRGEIFSVYYPELLQQSETLFKLFYYAKGFDVFYKTAAWARIYVNEGQFVYALYNAVLRRTDTLFLQLPPPYEVYPYAFFNSEVLEKAHHAKIFGKIDTKKSLGYETYIIPANYSGWYVNYEYDTENKLNYFVEDIGLNAYYFFFRLQYPFWMSSKEFQLPEYRGAEYLYGHKQIMARYFLERLSNDLGKMEDFDWSREFYAGYYPTMTYHNGLPFAQRPHWNRFPHYKFKYIQDIREMETRVAAAIDSGMVMGADGKRTSIYTPDGLNILGNLIEGNVDSCNIEFYGSIDKFARKILGFNLEPATSYQIYPSALESSLTSMRDPAFYRLYKRIFYYYYRYKLHQKAYTSDEVVYPNLKVESFMVDKLITYFDQFDSSISNGLMVHSQAEAENMVIKIRQHRLNHKPFTFHLTINSEKPTKATIRIFIGPKYDVHHKQMDMYDSLKYFYEIDNYVIDLNAGSNKLARKSEECFFSIQDPEPSESFYKRLLKAIEGTETLSYYEHLYGFPGRLLLPKGKKDGMPLRVFVHVSPVEQERSEYVSRIFGSYSFDKRTFGYPLDRPIQHFDYNGPNMQMKDVLVYHKDEPMTY